MTSVLAQQGQFAQFSITYCCLLPAGMAAALGIVYFAIRFFVQRSEHRD